MNPAYQSYAPTYSSSLSALSSRATISLDEEVKLFTNTSQRELWESLAEIYSIIITLEHLEKAFIKDSIAASAYTPTCQRLLSQYRTILTNDAVLEHFGDLEVFMQRWGVEAPAATRRLKTGIPATVEHPGSGGGENGGGAERASGAGMGGNGGGQSQGASSAKLAAEATEKFITCMDALRLSYKAKEELHPCLADVITTVDKVSGGKEFKARGDIVKWLITLNGMKVGEEITDEQSREMLFEIEAAYEEFHNNLQ